MTVVKSLQGLTSRSRKPFSPVGGLAQTAPSKGVASALFGRTFHREPHFTEVLDVSSLRAGAVTLPVGMSALFWVWFTLAFVNMKMKSMSSSYLVGEEKLLSLPPYVLSMRHCKSN